MIIDPVDRVEHLVRGEDHELILKLAIYVRADLRHCYRVDYSPGEPFGKDLPDIAEVWRRGSVVSSWLLDLTAMALTENPTLSEYEGYVQDSGEGRWTIQAALEEAVPADVLTAALYVRFRSRQQHTFAEKMLSAMRQKFGGHIEAGAPKTKKTA